MTVESTPGAGAGSTDIVVEKSKTSTKVNNAKGNLSKDQSNIVTRFLFVHPNKGDKTTKADYIKCATRIGQMIFGAGGLLALLMFLGHLVPIPGLSNVAQVASPAICAGGAGAAVVAATGGQVGLHLGGLLEETSGKAKKGTGTTSNVRVNSNKEVKEEVKEEVQEESDSSNSESKKESNSVGDTD